MEEWNYLAAKITGDGTLDIVETELPLEIRSIDRRLSAPPTLSGTITNEVKRLKKDGQPIFEPWQTAIIAVADDQVRGAGIYRKPNFNGADWELDVIGFTGYAQGQMYDDSRYFVDEDPLNIFRHIWTYLQSRPNGNLGITIDPLTCPVRVGKTLEQVQFTAETSPGTKELVSFEAGPKKLNWYDTTDLGKEIDSYAKATPFDWLERASWLGDSVGVHIALGYPTLGARKTKPRLVLGENLATEPRITEADYINQCYVLGAGEGRQAIRGYYGVSDGRLRRAMTVEDKSLKSVTDANAYAKRTLERTRGQFVIDTVEVFEHSNAPLEAIELGDEIQLYAETDWAVVDQYVRVVGRSDAPGKSDRATLTIVRSETA